MPVNVPVLRAGTHVRQCSIMHSDHVHWSLPTARMHQPLTGMGTRLVSPCSVRLPVGHDAAGPAGCTLWRAARGCSAHPCTLTRPALTCTSCDAAVPGLRGQQCRTAAVRGLDAAPPRSAVGAGSASQSAGGWSGTCPDVLHFAHSHQQSPDSQSMEVAGHCPVSSMTYICKGHMMCSPVSCVCSSWPQLLWLISHMSLISQGPVRQSCKASALQAQKQLL